MSKQLINLGTQPTGAGGDTNRSANVKSNANFAELYAALGGSNGGGDGSVLPPALPISKGGTGASTAEEARTSLGLGQVMNIGAFGLGKKNDISAEINNSYFFNEKGAVFGLCDLNTIIPTIQSGASVITTTGFSIVGSSWWQGAMNQLIMSWGQLYIRCADNAGGFSKPMLVLSQLNTTTDANGFVKAASPIVNLYTNRIELNDEAKQQDIVFKRGNVGEYLLTGSIGFAQEGWYIEMPKDANGNVLVAVVYEQLANNDISIKTYAKKFDDETGDIVANLTKPRDIPEGRFISLRLQELPKLDPQTNTAQA